MQPCLPQFDPTPDARAATVAKDRARYALNRDFGGLPFPTSIPLQEKPTPYYLFEGAKWSAKSAANIAAAQASSMRQAPNQSPRELVQSAAQSVYGRIQRKIWGPHRDVRIPHWQERAPLDIADYGMFPLVRKPASMPLWRHDWWFARERVAGTNPILIESISAVPANVPLQAQDYARAMNGDRLDAALAERRVFMVDHGMLQGIGAGTGAGFRKWLYAPISLYALTADRQRLLPVCIQCSQTPGPDNPLFFPWDDTAWLMARTTVQVSDSNYHGVVQHGTHCHMIMGVFSICMHRSLAPNHPLSILLTPNLQFSVFVDNLTSGLFKPDGRTPVIQSVSEEGTLALSRWGLDTFDWNGDAVPNRFASRGVLDPTCLPDYPARDDLLSHWNTLRRFVATYVGLYYGSDADVGADAELQAFVAALQHPQQGGLKGIGRDGQIQDIDSLVTFIAQAIQRASSYHAVINYSVYDAMGYMPNMPMAQYAPAPKHRDHPWEDFLAMLPPRSEMYRQFNDVYVVGALRVNQLGCYPNGHFQDRRARPLVQAYRAELDQIEFDIERRNRTAIAPYDILLPSLVTASIHV